VYSVDLEYYVHQADDVGIRAPIGTQWIALDFHYDPRLVDRLKVHFGWDTRRWNPEKKLWYVWRDLEDRLLKILKELGYSVAWTRTPRKKTASFKSAPPPPPKESVFEAFRRDKAKADRPKRAAASSPPPQSPRPQKAAEPPRPPPPRPTVATPRTPTDYDTLEILPTARFEVAKAAYRALSMVYHPDQGGDVRKMTALNAAWERLCRCYGRQT
jgi:hypothetical protein